MSPEIERNWSVAWFMRCLLISLYNVNSGKAGGKMGKVDGGKTGHPELLNQQLQYQGQGSSNSCRKTKYVSHDFAKFIHIFPLPILPPSLPISPL